MTAAELAMVLLSALLHASWSASIKGSADPMQFNLLQVVVAAPVCVAILATGEWRLTPGVLPWLAAACIVHALYFYCLSRAYARADLSLVYPIARSTPAFLPVVAMPLLGESLSLVGGLGIAVVVAGIWIVHWGEGRTGRRWLGPGMVFAYLTLLTTVGYAVTDKAVMVRLAATDWPHLLPRALFFFVLLELGAGLLFAPLAWLHGDRKSFGAALRRTAPRAGFAVVVSACSYGLILQALRTAPASYVVAARQTSVLFALGLGALLLGERPTRPRIAGAAATVLGVILIGIAP
ncbi:MAG: EamA family transporter [Proteobacteria bacterium]|nr:EamA family transporter [Pseudomonadota bacterium]